MKISILSFLFVIILMSCGSDGSIGNSTVDKVEIEELLSDYENCQSLGKEVNDCKSFTAKAINRYFGVNDLKREGKYIDYNEIYNFILSNDDWRSLGKATDQEVLDNAQYLANKRIPVIAINTEDEHKFTVLIVKGEQVKSSKWNVKVPNSAAFFPNKGPKPFINKTLNYVWSSPKGVEIFVRN